MGLVSFVYEFFNQTNLNRTVVGIYFNLASGPLVDRVLLQVVGRLASGW